MGPIPPETFADRVRELEKPALAAFVADIWRARGRDVESDGDLLRARDGESDPVVAAVAPDGERPEDSDPDVLVAGSVSPEADDDAVRTLGPGDLRRTALYGLESEAADPLLEEHLGVPCRGGPWGSEPEDGSTTSDATAGADGSPPGGSDSGSDSPGGRESEPAGGSGSGRPVEPAGSLPAETGPDDPGAPSDRTERRGSIAAWGVVPDRSAAGEHPPADAAGARGRTTGGPADASGSGGAVGRDGDPEWTPAGRDGRATAGGSGAESGDTDGVIGGAGETTGRRGLLVAVVVLLAAAGGAVAMAGPGGGLLDAGAGAATPDGAEPGTQQDATPYGDAAKSANGSSEVEPATATAAVPPHDDEGTNGSGLADELAEVPGLGPEGITDAERLAAAHADAVDGRSYTLALTYREYQDGEPVGVVRETVTVESPAVHRSSVTSIGATTRDPLIVADVEAYADGETRYERPLDQPDTYLRAPPGSEGQRSGLYPVGGNYSGQDRFAGRVGAYLGWFLSVEQSAVVESFTREGRTYYWVTIDGDPWPGVENTTGSALIDDRGIVHEVRREYNPPRRPGTRIVVRIRYADVGETTVTPPSWYEEAKNVTGVAQTPTPTPAPTQTRTPLADGTAG